MFKNELFPKRKGGEISENEKKTTHCHLQKNLLDGTSSRWKIILTSTCDKLLCQSKTIDRMLLRGFGENGDIETQMKTKL